MASANRASLAYAVESAWGTSPGGTALYQRYAGETLAENHDFITSDEIRPDRQVTDRALVGLRVLGDINFELSYGAFDDWLAMSIQAGNGSQTPSAAWSAASSITAATIGFTAPNLVTDSGSGFVAAGFDAGDWIKISGAVAANNNGIFKIQTVAAGTLTLKQQTITTAAAGPSVTVKNSGTIVNGSQFNSMTIERKHTDLPVKPYGLYRGVMPNTFELGVTPKSFAKGKFGMLGKLETLSTTSSFSGFTNAPTNRVMEGIRGVKYIFEADTSVNGTEFIIRVNNNLEELTELGTQTAAATEINVGEYDAQGTFRAYFRDSDTIYEKFLNSTETGIAIVFQDAAGNTIVIDHPSVIYTEGKKPAEGKNRPVIRDLGWQARMHSTELITTRISRIAA